MIKKIGVQFFSQLNHPRGNFASWQPPDFCMQEKFCLSTTHVFTQSFKYSWLHWPRFLIICTASSKTISNETEILFINMHICEEYMQWLLLQLMFECHRDDLYMTPYRYKLCSLPFLVIKHYFSWKSAEPLARVRGTPGFRGTHFENPCSRPSRPSGNPCQELFRRWKTHISCELWYAKGLRHDMEEGNF